MRAHRVVRQLNEGTKPKTFYNVEFFSWLLFVVVVRRVISNQRGAMRNINENAPTRAVIFFD